MTWLQRYRLRRYFEDSIWIFPVFGMLTALGAVRFVNWIDRRLSLESSAYPDAARALLGILAASMFTLVVFVSSALLLAVQLASAQLTPRIIGLIFRDPVTKLSLTLFVFTFTFSLAALLRIGSSAPRLTLYIAAYGCVVALGFFLYLIDRLGRSLRASGALRLVARLGNRVIEHVYPRLLPAECNMPRAPMEEVASPCPFTIQTEKEGVILAVDIRGLVALGDRFNCVIEMVPQVGDFVSAGEPLFRVSRGGTGLIPHALRHSVAVGSERMFDQDPAFVFRVIVDVASKGLSPAINDPTTAVLAIDQIHRLLRNIGQRDLNEGTVRDAEGRLRLVYRTPDWEDFVQLAVTEIRQFGGLSIQVARRLRAMLENLIQTLPESRAALLRHELDLLHRSIERSFPEPEDRARAGVSDLQGVGGKRMQSERAADPQTAE